MKEWVIEIMLAPLTYDEWFNVDIPDTLENSIKRFANLKRKRPRLDDIRLRNVTTGEVIPGAAL